MKKYFWLLVTFVFLIVLAINFIKNTPLDYFFVSHETSTQFESVDTIIPKIKNKETSKNSNNNFSQKEKSEQSDIIAANLIITERELNNLGLTHDEIIQQHSLSKIDQIDNYTEGYEVNEENWDKLLDKYSDNTNTIYGSIYENNKMLLDIGVTMLIKRNYSKAEEAFHTIKSKHTISNQDLKARIAIMTTYIFNRQFKNAIEEYYEAVSIYEDNERYMKELNRISVVILNEFSKY